MGRRKGLQATKPGKHGTLRLYRIVYRDEDPACPDFTSLVWRYNEEHARESFVESIDGDSWQIVRVETVSRDFALDHGILAS